MTKKIAIVTGANGWLGFNLSYFLVNGHPDNENIKTPKFDEIRCLILKGDDPSRLEVLSPKIKIYNGDVTNSETLIKVFEGTTNDNTSLFHTAGIIHPQKTKQFYDINLQGTKNLIELASKNDLGKAVIISSNSPIGCNPFPEHRFDEDSPFNPYMHYGKSKMKMEKFLEDFSRNSNLNISIIRCPWFYGPNQPPRQTLFFSMIKNGKMPIIGSGNNRRSMSFVDNLCQGVMLAESYKATKLSKYWISDENAYSMNEIVSTVKDLLKNDFNMVVSNRTLRLPSIVSEIAFFIDWIIQSIGLYHQKFHVLSEMNKNIACSIDKAKKELGYKPKVNLKEGMKRSIQWCLDNNYKI